MASWGWVLLGISFLGMIIAIIVALIKSRPIVRGITEEDRKALAELDVKRVQVELDAEKEKSKKLDEITQTFHSRFEELRTWVEDVEEDLDDERRKQFEKYCNDVDAAGDELDELLGISRSDDQEDETEEG